MMQRTPHYDGIGRFNGAKNAQVNSIDAQIKLGEFAFARYVVLGSELGAYTGVQLMVLTQDNEGARPNMKSVVLNPKSVRKGNPNGYVYHKLSDQGLTDYKTALDAIVTFMDRAPSAPQN